MEERTSSATFAQFHMAMAYEKSIVVYDPERDHRTNRDKQGNPVHPNFNHLMGKALVHSPLVQWVTTTQQVLECITKH